MSWGGLKYKSEFKWKWTSYANNIYYFFYWISIFIFFIIFPRKNHSSKIYTCHEYFKIYWNWFYCFLKITTHKTFHIQICGQHIGFSHFFIQCQNKILSVVRILICFQVLLFINIWVWCLCWLINVLFYSLLKVLYHVDFYHFVRTTSIESWINHFFWT